MWSKLLMTGKPGLVADTNIGIIHYKQQQKTTAWVMYVDRLICNVDYVNNMNICDLVGVLLYNPSMRN